MSNKKALYKQKFFVMGLPILIEKYFKTEERKFIYLIAVGQLLPGLPKDVLIQELPVILPLIIESLKLRPLDAGMNDSQAISQNNLILSTVQVLSNSIVKEMPLSLVDHLSVIIPSLLELAKHQYASLRLRQTSLQSLFDLCSLPYVALFKYKTEVLNSLNAALDDRKKVVRREAVRTRNKWCSLAYKD
jgi:DNA repair/transcription protein MET18/MMS19